ncbi:aminotransferase class V-fold PLP-dependent enzyme [Actinomycetospora endophytica]|uniref:Aminotransferase class V-fold PLP-dependent enzyme n=1 Tax=Actinomycetospora endophytica TaxID=2291215 RepID=A0ABS8PEX1_9PSEU|nr:aminotransferase class V-fold PLP-dependent enzyme [Actinomycetospora endophytica]MCD2195549.1 aminotransferase class V-fold PLP-dependent enzyme [Actinomycetospora endophytica]
MTVAAFGASFDVEPGYLNTASVGIPPRHVVEAVRGWVDDWAHGGISAVAMDAPVDATRAAFAELTGFGPDDVAVGASVSGLLGPIAAAFPPGTRVLTAEREFTSVSWPFAACGHVVDEVPLGEVPARAGEYDVVAVSVAQSADGALVDLEALRTSAGAAFVVLDGTQSIGWSTADLSWADAVVAGGYKWLLAPRGASWLACSGRLLERVTPSNAGWYAGDDRWQRCYGLPLGLASGARRLDVSPAWGSFVGAAASLGWHASLDRAAVHDHGVGLAALVRKGLDLPPSASPIVSVPQPDAGDRLAAAGIHCAPRAGATRVAFHLHNTEADVELLLGALSRL